MFIGIDLGTSSVKLILVDKQGTLKRTVSRGYDLIIPQPSWSEQDPNAWFTQTIDALKELVVGYEDHIEALSFSGQMHGLVLLDEDDKVIRNALLWNDQRTIKEVDYLNNEIGIDNLLNYTGNIALTGLTAPKILWVKNNEPELYKKISKVMLPKDYVSYLLSGVFASDVSDLSGTLYFDVANRAYSKEMLEILGLNESQLPAIHESTDVVGTLKAELKELLNIKNDVKVVIGGGDQAVGAVGVGIVEDGSCSISLGTSGVVFVASDTFNIDHKSYLQSYAHSNGKYHVMGVMLNAAGALKWWSEQINNDKEYDVFFDNLNSTPIDDSIFFLPYLSGERSPINDANAKGVFFGLGLHHQKANMDRAVIEGVTFALRDTFELVKNLGVNIQTLRITGGGAKSNIWAQMISNVMNVDVVRIKIEEGPALGAAILAMVGTGAYHSVAEACTEIVEIKDTFSPTKTTVKLYQEKYDRFIKLYPNLKSLFFMN